VWSAAIPAVRICSRFIISAFISLFPPAILRDSQPPSATDFITIYRA
jgi:hypothetical protein